MSGPLRSYNQVPFDPSISPVLADYLAWVQTTLQSLQGTSLFPPAPPMVTTVSHPGAVLIVWNEITGVTTYCLFETSSQSTPPGVPLATVPSNKGAISNSFLRAGLNDTVTRYYWVQAINPKSAGQISKATPGAALAVAATVIPVSQTPVNKGGVGGGVNGGGGFPGRNNRD
jgi:hypothetical protein